MHNQSILLEEEVKSSVEESGQSPFNAGNERQDLTPRALKMIVLSLIFAALYLAASGAWVWAAMYRSQDCL